MGIFKKAEKGLEGLVEGGFGRAFKSNVQPVELAHKLAKEMGDHKTVGVTNVYVPSDYDIYLGTNDYTKLSSLGDSLKGELANYLTALARREGWTLTASPRIELHEDVDLRVGEFGIGASEVSLPAEAPPVAQRPPVAPPVAAPIAAPVAPVVAPAPPVAAPQLNQTVMYEQPVPSVQPSLGEAALRGPEGSWELINSVTLIGRSRRCDVVLADPNVSRQHAEVRRQNEGFVIRDLGSTNGMRVNRRATQGAVLQHGDRIELGATELIFERLS